MRVFCDCQASRQQNVHYCDDYLAQALLTGASRSACASRARSIARCRLLPRRSAGMTRTDVGLELG